MYKYLIVDKNLFHLSNVIFDLANYKFDNDIIKLLNELKTLVDKKMFTNFDNNEYCVLNDKITIRFSKN